MVVGPSMYLSRDASVGICQLFHLSAMRAAHNPGYEATVEPLVREITPSTDTDNKL